MTRVAPGMKFGKSKTFYHFFYSLVFCILCYIQDSVIYLIITVFSKLRHFKALVGILVSFSRSSYSVVFGSERLEGFPCTPPTILAVTERACSPHFPPKMNKC